MDALAPFQPTQSEPWSRARAAHLARRAGFGLFGAALDELWDLGPEAAVARFVDPTAAGPEADGELDREIAALGSTVDALGESPGSYGRASTDRLRSWWLYRMVRTARPLTEKLALLWHDHFAVQEAVVIRTHLLLLQNQTFRRLGAGRFRELVLAVARDPAMLVFLDNRLSTKENPNENWARELLELFTLGVDRYSQGDVRELARVFTGWTTPRRDSPEFGFDPELHDTGEKRVLGKRIPGRVGPEGEQEGVEAVDHILAQADHGEFLARKLLGWFASHAAPDRVVAEFADVLRGQNGHVGEALRILFRSRWFYAKEQDHALYKHPIELVVTAARGLELKNPHLAGLVEHARALGMDLLEPPSVDGWEHGSAWVRTGSVAPRLNLAIDLAELPHAARTVTGRATLDLDALGGPDAHLDHALVQTVSDRLLQQPLEAEQASAVVQYLAELGPSPTDERAARTWRRNRVRAVAHLVLGSPQFTLA